MGLLDLYDKYLGNPSRQIVGGGIRGLLGFDPPEYADGLGLDVYRNAVALSNSPTPLAFAAAPMAIVKASKAAKAVDTAADVARTANTVKKFTYPQEKALEVARLNAVKMLGLPENNTALDRARALGFDTPAAHFSRHGVDVHELDSSKFAIAPFDAVGTHVGTQEAALSRFQNTVGYKVNNPSYANDELKAVTYPVLIKSKRPMLDASGKPNAETPLTLSFSEKSDYGNLRESNARLRQEVFAKFDSIPYVNDVEAAGSVSHIVPPKNIRSRFAAFDPARVNENDLLGRADVDLLKLLAAGGLLGTGAYQFSNKDNP